MPRRKRKPKKLKGYTLHLHLYPIQRRLLFVFTLLMLGCVYAAWDTQAYKLWLGLAGSFLFLILILSLQYRKSVCYLNAHKSLTDLRQMDPFEFELYVVNLLKKIGYRAKCAPPRRDFGADFFASKWTRNYIGQVKRYSASKKITSDKMQQFIGAMQIHGYKHGMYVATTKFTHDAKRLAEKHNIILFDQDDLTKAIAKVNRC